MKVLADDSQWIVDSALTKEEIRAPKHHKIYRRTIRLKKITKLYKTIQCSDFLIRPVELL